MKQNFTPAWKKLSVLSLLFTLLCNSQTVAQTNIALSSSVTQLSSAPICGSTNLNYNTCLYTDNSVPTYNTPAAAQNWSFVNSNGWIMFSWSALQPAGSIYKMVFYKDFRPLVNAEIQYFSYLSNSWVTHITYNNANNFVADSILFTPIPEGTDSIRLFNINAGNSATVTNNPTTREIQIWSTGNSCIGTPINSVQARYNGAVVPSPVNNVCLGSQVFLNATSNNTSSGHAYQWQVASASGGPWTSISGATHAGYAAEAFGTLYYRVIDTCLNGGAFSTSATVQVSAAAPMSIVPNPNHLQNFDPLWSTACAPTPHKDIPAVGWSNTPNAGYNTWRVDSAVVASSGWYSTNLSANNPYSGAGIAYPFTTPLVQSNRSARSHTSGMVPGTVANLNMHLDLSTTLGDKTLYFYMVNMPSGLPGGDSLRVLMSTDNGINWTQLASWDTAGTTVASDPKWRRRVVPIASNSPNTIIRFQSFKNSSLSINDGSDIGIDSVFIAAPCNGMPNAGTINMASTIQACPGATFNLSPTGTTMSGGLVYTWEKLINGCVIPDANVGGFGANTLYFTTPPIYDTICYRLKVRCGNDSAYTNTITFNVPEPTYATLPFSESFDSWITRCAASTSPAACTQCQFEVPGIHWANTPVTGSNSWRRHDHFSTATSGWSNPTGGNATVLPFVPAPQGTHYARFHSVGVPNGVTGSLDLLINCSSSIGTKELWFHYINPSGNDSLRILMSTNGGMTFTQLASFNQSAAWAQQLVSVPSNSATTVIRFQGYSDGATAGTDIGIDSVKIVPPCTGAPNPGVISSAAPCPGTTFTLSLSGTTQAAGLTYEWQFTTDTANIAWQPVSPAGTGTAYTTSIFVNTFYRVIVTCNNSGQSVSTPIQYVPVANFYYCYCNSNAQSSLGADIGNILIQHLPSSSTVYTFGNATPVINNSGAISTYTDNRWPIEPIIPLYHDSTYRFVVSQINSGAFTAATASIWLDMDRSGVFDADERIMLEYTASNAVQAVDTFTIPDSLPVGITGLRIILESPQNNNPDPCFIYQSGETEDYLVDIRYHPCDGPANAGTVFASDTSSCPNYLVTLYDTSHVHNLHNISWVWQFSPDGFSWADVPGSQMRDTIDHILTGQTFFRLRMVCAKIFSFDTTYSNEVKISINPPYACYCYSLADGGTLDSSDLGAFTLIMTPDTFSINVGGPHLNNAEAYRSRTDYTKAGDLEIWTNGSYPFLFYHIMRGSVHADAKITMFMDFNNDLEYDIHPPYNERVFTGFATANNFVVTGNLTIPPFAIANVKTGMRIIINNDVGPNVQSDSACGPYTSGETEDYVVIFKDVTSATTIKNVTQLYLYPNPTDGRFSIMFNAIKPVEKATVTVTSVTGQVVMQKQYLNAGKEFTRDLDLSGMSRGVYLVELQADEERLVRKVVVQ